MFKFLILSAVVATAYAGKCPKVLGKNPIDEQRMLGEWSFIAGTAVKGEFQCAKLDYKYVDGKRVMGIRAINEQGKPTKGAMHVDSVFEGPGADYFGVIAMEDGSVSPIIKKAIVDTDYDNYALLALCKTVFDNNTKTFITQSKAVILGRQPSISAETYEMLTNTIAQTGIDVSTLKLAVSADC